MGTGPGFTSAFEWPQTVSTSLAEAPLNEGDTPLRTSHDTDPYLATLFRCCSDPSRSEHPVICRTHSVAAMDVLDRVMPDASPLSKYEIERLQRIEANRKRMGARRAVRGRPERRSTTAVACLCAVRWGRLHARDCRCRRLCTSQPYPAEQLPGRPLRAPLRAPARVPAETRSKRVCSRRPRAPPTCLGPACPPPLPPPQRSWASWRQRATC